ncbi:MAG: PQQ-binding-like beta-propeller repeat protein [Gemmataceae bacterium]|nr:PQQ-binding-like beta-propeller repeat protein [Gemmataceae bacterium]MDW8265216.1 PQQ-binding-like beta-propeller repeat protein [Gemmataceae bacterium]
MRGLLSGLTLGLVSMAVWAGDWPQFRGPGGSGVSSDSHLPIRWSSTENIAWKANLPGRGLSSPVVAKGRVFLTACSAFQQTRLHVLCFDLKDGKLLWERQFWATGNTMCHPKTNMAAPTPVTDGQRVFALFATCDLVCLDVDGNLVWYRSLTSDYPTVTNQVGMAASPVLHQDTLVLLLENAGESFAAGIDAHTGQNRWKIERKRRINWNTPLLFTKNGQTSVIFQTPDELAAFDPRTGEKRWSYAASELATIPSPAAGDGMLLVPGKELLLLRPGDSAAPELVWQSARLRPATASPTIYKNRVYVLTGAGVLNCADAQSGKVLWQERLKGPFSASPLIAGDRLYAVSEDGVTSVVQLGDEPKVLSVNPIGETILASPVPADGKLLLRSDEHLFCIGAGK